MTEMQAPTGSEIQGTSEVVLGAAHCSFDGPDSYDHTGGTEMFWDTSTTETIEGVPMFTDRDGSDWLLHHLLPQTLVRYGDEDEEFEIPPMSDGDLAVLAEEERIGYSLRAARQLAGTADVLSASDRTQVNMIVDDLARRYAKAKARSVKLIEAHIAAHAPADAQVKEDA